MPHKHTRRKAAGDAAHFDLPPSALARPLPVATAKAARVAASSSKRPAKKSLRPSTATSYGPDDTPKAFARLMRLSSTQRPKPSRGLDDGAAPSTSKTKASRKRKRGQDGNEDEGEDEDDSHDKHDEHSNAAADSPPLSSTLKIQPGESLRDFSARVDRTLPVSGLARRGKNPGDRMTKHEKRLRKLQAGWRVDEARIREKEEEEREQAEEEAEELREKYGEDVLLSTTGKAKKGGREEDPWAVLKKKREAPAALHDVVQAPPQFSALPKEKIKMRNGAGARVANVPSAAGSLRRREELGATRKSVIEGYRKMMEAKKGGN